MRSSRAFLAQSIATLYVAAASQGVAIALAKLMTPAEFGRYVGVVTVATFLSLLQDAGLRTLIARENTAATAGFAHAPDRLVAQATSHLALSTMVIAATFFVLPIAEREALAAAVCALGAVLLVQLASTLLKAAGRFEYDAIWLVTTRTVSACAVIGAAWLVGGSTLAVFLAWLLALLATFALFPLGVRIRPRMMPSLATYRAAAGFLWIDLATCIYHRIDILLIGLLRGSAAEIGWYAAAYRLLDGVLLLTTPFASLLFRRLRLLHFDEARFAIVMKRSLMAAAAAGLMAAAGGWLFGASVASFVYGEHYASQTGSVLPWLFTALAFALPNLVLTQAAIALGRLRLYAVAAALAAMVNIGLNVVLLPGFAIQGAAIATIVTEAVLALTLWTGLRPGRLRRPDEAAA